MKREIKFRAWDFNSRSWYVPTEYGVSEGAKEFSVYIKILADKQKNQLMNDGLYGGKEVNSTMAIFLLKVIHGFNEGPNTLIQNNFFNEAKKQREEYE